MRNGSPGKNFSEASKRPENLFLKKGMNLSDTADDLYKVCAGD